jgi:hypothetical protein
MAAKPRFTSGGKTNADRQPLPDPATDAFPAEKDVSVPPPGADQTLGAQDAETAKKGRPRKAE